MPPKRAHWEAKQWAALYKAFMDPKNENYLKDSVERYSWLAQNVVLENGKPLGDVYDENQISHKIQNEKGKKGDAEQALARRFAGSPDFNLILRST